MSTSYYVGYRSNGKLDGVARVSGDDYATEIYTPNGKGWRTAREGRLTPGRERSEQSPWFGWKLVAEPEVPDLLAKVDGQYADWKVEDAAEKARKAAYDGPTEGQYLRGFVHFMTELLKHLPDGITATRQLGGTGEPTYLSSWPLGTPQDPFDFSGEVLYGSSADWWLTIPPELGMSADDLFDKIAGLFSEWGWLLRASSEADADGMSKAAYARVPGDYGCKLERYKHGALNIEWYSPPFPELGAHRDMGDFPSVISKHGPQV